MALTIYTVIHNHLKFITYIIRQVGLCWNTKNIEMCLLRQAAVIIINAGLLSKYAKLIILQNLALDKRMRGPGLL